MESCEYMSSLRKKKKKHVEETLLKSKNQTLGTCFERRVDLREVELEVELPRRRAGRIVSVFVHKREAELDDLQKVDVTPQQLVLVVHCAAELADRPDDDAGEFCVLTGEVNA